MNEKLQSMKLRAASIDFLFCLLLLCYPILSLVWRRDYPVFAQEVLWLFVGAAGFSVVFSLIVSGLRPAVSNLLTVLLILLAFMVQFSLRMEGIVLCVVGGLLLILVFKDRFRQNFLIVLLALIVGAWFDSDSNSSDGQSPLIAEEVDHELTPVVHILLDAFVGVGGLPDYPASEIIREEILTFFEKNEFKLFSHAYSRYAITGDSVYFGMNFGHDDESLFILQAASGNEQVMPDNALFDLAEDLGYRFNIYQTSHINLCHSNPESVDRCWQYDHPNVSSFAPSSDVRMKVLMLAKVLLAQAPQLKDAVPDPWELIQQVIAVHDPQVFEMLNADLGDQPQGYYFFAHALLPHTPFIYRSDCSPSYNNLSDLYKVSYFHDEPELRDNAYEMRYGLYYGQVACALRSLQGVIDLLKNMGLYDKAVVLVHGDHGPLISKRRPIEDEAENLTYDDYRAAYSTLFAVKYPGSQFSVDDRPLSLAYLLEKFSGVLPNYVREASSYPEFNPVVDGTAEQTGLYVYLPGSFPLKPMAVDIFHDRRKAEE